MFHLAGLNACRGHETKAMRKTTSRPAPAGWLAAGDLAVFLGFAAAGRWWHALEVTAGGTVAAAAPFFAAWATAGVLLGTFRPEAVDGGGRTALQTVRTWALAGPAGLLLRAVFLGGPVSVSFAAVTLALTLILLLAWRVTFALVRGRRA